ncbi:MAG: ABC transporter permease [Bryobacteraceae bacterium]
MRQDLRYACRVFRQNPGFTAVAVLSLALGIGANTAIFSLINAVLLRYLPVRAPEELVILARNPPRPSASTNYPDYVYLRDNAKSYSGVIAYSGVWAWGFAAEGQATQLAGVSMVSGNYFDVLGVTPALGRVFNEEDNKTEGAHPYAVLSHGFWMRAFGGDTGVIGRRVRINGSPFTVVGVSRAGFTGAEVGASPDVFVPVMMVRSLNPSMRDWNTRFFWWLTTIARLKPGVSLQQANAELVVLRERIEANDPRNRRGAPAWDKDRAIRQRGVVLPGAHGFAFMRNMVQKPLLILMVVAGVVLLIACANVANLLLARAAARQREIAIRLSIGAARWRLVRQLLVESVLLSVLGAAAGTAFAWVGVRILMGFAPRGGFPLTLDLTPDWRVLLFLFAVALAAGTLAGLAPALRATRPEILPWLKSETAPPGFGGRRFDLRKGLVVVQIALSVLLIAGAALFVRSLANLRGLDPGFRRENVLLVSIDPRLIGYKAQQVKTFFDRLITGTQRLPGVRSASGAAIVPLGGMRWNGDVTVEGYRRKADERPYVDFNTVTPRWFETVGIPILLGRDFREQDIPLVAKDRPENFKPEMEDDWRGDIARVAVVNESFARRYFGGQSPVGKRFSQGMEYRAGKSFEIIGVVRDAHYFNLREEVEPMVYVPAWTAASERMWLCVRTAGEPAALISGVRRRVREIDPGLWIMNARTLEQNLDDNIVQERMVATLSGLFSLLALALAAVGLYGVMAHAVTRRTREIGIRMAMGAPRGEVLWMVLRDALLMAAAGAVLGIPAALALSKLAASLLFGVSPQDPVTLAAAVALLGVVAAAASWLPARRAATVDPMDALRYE